MLSEDVFFKTLSTEELWKRYCGFLDLSTGEFMKIQESLLMEELSLVAGTSLGRKALGPRPPRTVEEFRQTVPFTVYEDYEPALSERREKSLAAVPAVWCHSSGRGGVFKWIPHSEALMDKTARNCIGLFNLASASRRGQISVRPGMRMLATVPLAPYTSGTIFSQLQKRFTFRAIPPLESVADLPFSEQVARAFELALREGFDVAGALASILVRLGQQMSGQSARGRLSRGILHPKALARLLRGVLRSRIQRRPIYPKDLWSPRGIMAGGVDTSIYRAEIEKYWGVTPFDVYASTETMFLGMQSWTRSFMTFLPDSVFLEFRPHADSTPNGEPQTATLLIDQLEPGRLYEVIITQFHGMPLLRYQLGDVIRVVEAGDSAAGISLPQIEVRRKIGEAINIGGLCALDERTLWGAIAAASVPCTDWTALKEYDGSETYLRIIVELSRPMAAREISRQLDAQLRMIDTDYADVGRYLGVNPVRTTVVSGGSFARYTEQKVREGAALSFLKPRHVNPSSEMVELLISMGSTEDRE